MRKKKRETATIKKSGTIIKSSIRYTAGRHKLVSKIIKPIFRIYLRIRYNYKAVIFSPGNIPGPYFILSSHTGALDPFFLALSFKEPIYFVASDHLFRLGFVSKIIRYLAAPIPIVKSQIDLQAMRQIISISREGGNVCLFPSGNRSFSGPELPIPEATGKLIKHMKCTVLFYRLEGGYMSTPRWARTARRGKMSGSVVRALTAEEAATMNTAELNQLTATLLEANPYKSDMPGKIKFAGRYLAEYLERVLFICPACMSISSLSSKGRELSCGCGFSAEYKSDGWFRGLNSKSEKIIARLPNTAAFDFFQNSYMENLISQETERQFYLDTPLFSDQEEQLFRTRRANNTELVLTGTLKLYSNRLVLEGQNGRSVEFSLCLIGRMSVHGPQVFQLHDISSNTVFELKSLKPRSAYKYLVAIELLKKYCEQIREEVI